MSEQTISKYINQTLAELLERALTYKRLSYAPTSSSRDKIAWKALSLELTRAYNFALATIGPYGSSKLAMEQKPLTDARLKGNGYKLTSQEEIEELVDSIFDSNSLERENQRKKLAEEKAAVIAASNTITPEVYEALILLAKHRQLSTFMNVEGLMQAPIKIPNKPRGNPYKGALVRKYTYMNYPKAIARVMADKELNQEPKKTQELSNKLRTTQSDEAAFNDLYEDDGSMSMQEAIELVEAEERNKLGKPGTSQKDIELLNMLAPKNKAEIFQGDEDEPDFDTEV